MGGLIFLICFDFVGVGVGVGVNTKCAIKKVGNCMKILLIFTIKLKKIDRLIP